MMRKFIESARACMMAQLFIFSCWGQIPEAHIPNAASVASRTGKARSQKTFGAAGHLHTELTRIPSEMAQGFLDPLRCGDDGNLYWQPQTHDEILKVVNLKGHEITAYNERAETNGGHSLGLAFICYSQNPERFTFLETTDDNKLGLITATPE